MEDVVQSVSRLYSDHRTVHRLDDEQIRGEDDDRAVL